MCVESISIALCAPAEGPSLSFTCGKLHLIAGQRDVCHKAKGACVCFFGTCGSISQAAAPTAVDWATIPKIRCLVCTRREDHVGAARDHREILESPLLTRNAVIPSWQGSYAEAIRGLWRGNDTCPFHTETKANVAVGDQNKSVCKDSDEAKDSQMMPTRAGGPQASPPHTGESSPAENSFEPIRGLAASHWANVSDYTPVRKFQPRARCPIPIVRPPPSEPSSSNTSIPQAESVKVLSEDKVEEADEAVRSVGALDPKASFKETWCPPHLRYLSEEQAVGAALTVV